MMAEKRPRDLRDPDDLWWTIDQTAAHFGIQRRAVLAWIRNEGLQTFTKARLMRRADVLATFRKVPGRQLASRYGEYDSPTVVDDTQ